MNPIFQREARLIGEDGVACLSRRTAAVFGLGGVGSFAAEALIRAGVGHLLLIDGDVVEASNLNRQLVAEESTLGHSKAEIMADRAQRINPACRAEVIKTFYHPGDVDFIRNLHADFVIDAIDDVPAKISIAQICSLLRVAEASSMGTGNRLHPEQLEIGDIYKTSVCPMARKIRKALKVLKVPHLTVVFSKEQPRRPIGEGHAPGSISFVPPVAGMILAGIAVRTMLAQKESYDEIQDSAP